MTLVPGLFDSKAIAYFIIPHCLLSYRHWYLVIKNELLIILIFLIEKFQETGHHQGHTVIVVYTSHELLPINISFKFNKVVNKGIKVNY